MNFTTLNESIRYSKTPSVCVELAWAAGDRILALPTGFVASADWEKDERREKIDIDWGNWIITLIGHGLQRLPGSLIRGEICAVAELDNETAEATQGAVVLAILATEKKREE